MQNFIILYILIVIPVILGNYMYNIRNEYNNIWMRVMGN